MKKVVAIAFILVALFGCSHKKRTFSYEVECFAINEFRLDSAAKGSFSVSLADSANEVPPEVSQINMDVSLMPGDSFCFFKTISVSGNVISFSEISGDSFRVVLHLIRDDGEKSREVLPRLKYVGSEYVFL